MTGRDLKGKKGERVVGGWRGGRYAERGIYEIGNGERTFWSGEVDDITILFEHVDLLDGLDGLDVEFLEGGLQFFVVGA